MAWIEKGMAFNFLERKAVIVIGRLSRLLFLTNIRCGILVKFVGIFLVDSKRALSVKINSATGVYFYNLSR